MSLFHLFRITFGERVSTVSLKELEGNKGFEGNKGL